MIQQATTAGEAHQAPNVMRGLAERIGDDAKLDPVVRRLRSVASTVASSDLGPALRGDWLGHALHPMLTDLPLGCWMSAGLLDVVGGRGSRRAAQRLIGLGLLGVPATAAAGLTDWVGLARQPDRRVGAAHAAGNGIAAGIYFLSWKARRKGHHLRGMGWSMLGTATAMATGYLGRHLVFTSGSAIAARDVAAAGGVAAPGYRGDGAWHRFDEPGVHTEPVLVDLRGASAMLGVPVAQVEALVDQGVLVPTGGVPGDQRFADTDVMAVRLLGG
jgi:uncharacterized membrane protein